MIGSKVKCQLLQIVTADTRRLSISWWLPDVVPRDFSYVGSVAGEVATRSLKGLRGNKRFEWIARPPRVMAWPGHPRLSPM
jgi:hypothetical protein